MNTAVYEGGFEGFLTLIHNAYTGKQWPEQIFRSGFEPPEGLFEERFYLTPDRYAAAKVGDAFRKQAGDEAFKTLLYAWLHDTPVIDNDLSGFVRKLFKDSRQRENLSDPVIQTVSAAACFTGRELHRWEGFTRFSRLKDGALYAALEPKSDILALLGRHFQTRMPNESWILHDTRRRLAFVFKEGEGRLLNVAHADRPVLHTDEPFFRALWHCFFETTAITQRVSQKRQMHWVPKRFHPFMSEMNP